MTEAKQPEALRLADQLRALSFGGTCILAAAELRRQHARIADLEAQLSAIGAGGVEPLRSRQCLHGISEPSGWMPIETAPKECIYQDGYNEYAEYVLAWWPGALSPVRARWWESSNERRNFIADGSYAVFPTHWMPMPLPPSPSSADEGGSNEH